MARRLSVQVDTLLQVICEEPVTLRRIMLVLEGRAFMVSSSCSRSHSRRRCRYPVSAPCLAW
ncbi:hypothetical protein BH20VER1_BH20VER1_10310 [soil metagenome]